MNKGVIQQVSRLWLPFLSKRVEEDPVCSVTAGCVYVGVNTNSSFPVTGGNTEGVASPSPTQFCALDLLSVAVEVSDSMTFNAVTHSCASPSARRLFSCRVSHARNAVLPVRYAQRRARARPRFIYLFGFVQVPECSFIMWRRMRSSRTSGVYRVITYRDLSV